MWFSSKDYSKYPTYSKALELAASAGRGAEFSAYATLMDADSSDNSRELCRGWFFWAAKYPEIPAWKSPTTGSAAARKSNLVVGSFSTGIAAVACKSDVSWAQGLLVADHYHFGAEYRKRNGYPTENFQALDTSFWTWVDKKGLSIAKCHQVLDHAPILEWADFRTECIEGSDIRPAMFDLNVQHITNSKYDGVVTETLEHEVFDALNIPVKRFFEGFDDNWNRQHDYGGAIYAFVSTRSGFFNAKPRIPFWDENRGKYRKYESRRKNEGEEGSKILYPDVDRIACDRLMEVLDLWLLHITPDNYWDIVFAFPQLIRVGIAEGAKKAISLTGDGFPTVAVLAVTNWSVAKSEPRLLLPELAQLAQGGRAIDIWYDMDDPDAKIKAFLNGKAQSFKLAAALKAAGANSKTRSMFWDLKLGKGIDDAKAVLRSRSESIPAWILDTIKYSRHREIYSYTSKAYRLDPKRAIERDTEGDYLPGEIKVKPGHSTVIIADTGSGKTHQIKRLINHAKMMGMIAIVFTPTNKLGEQAAHNFGIPHRNAPGPDGQAMEIGDVLAAARRSGGLVICPDSIDWARSLIKNESSYLVVCDEAAKVLEHLSSGATIKDRYSEINQNFADLLTAAQSLVLAEAKLSEKDLLTFEAISGKPSLVYRHRKETGKRDVTMYTGTPGAISAALMSEVVDRLDRGERVVIPTDSQRMAIKIEQFLQQRFPELTGIRNDAQTSYIPDVKTLTRTPNVFLAQRQLDYLIYSPVCKAGWDLTGFDLSNGVRSDYHFDAVCAFFGVLPTSDLIQMVARYRPTVPLSISCPELIKQVGDEIYSSEKALRELRGEELTQNLRDCGLTQVVRIDVPLQQTLDQIYTHNTVRNGLEKSISRYSLQQRLTDDGHTVSNQAISLRELQLVDPDRYDNLKAICQSLKEINDGIDRQWGDVVAAVTIRPEDNLIEAARIDRLEAPTPDERAKAEKIRLTHRFPGVNFSDPITTFHSTRKYGKLGNGADLHAKISFEDLVKSVQRDRNTAILKENIVAVHHFSKEVQRIELLKRVGICDLLAGEYSKTSAEMIELKAKCLHYAKEFKRFSGLDFKPDQEVMTFWGRLMSKLSLPVGSYRPQGSDARIYHVENVAALVEKIDVLEEKQLLLQQKIDTKTVKVALLERCTATLFFDMQRMDAEPNKVSSASLEKQAHAIYCIQQQLTRTQQLLAKFTAASALISNKIQSLVDKFHELEVRGLLYDAAVKRLEAQSTTLINTEDITVVDSTSAPTEIGSNVRQLDFGFSKKRNL